MNFSIECKTKGGSRKNHTCVFPFTYNGVKYSACTDTNHDVKWCSTKTDSDGYFISDEWGNCDAGCPGVLGKI